jgi:hypothetical protein
MPVFTGMTCSGVGDYFAVAAALSAWSSAFST